MLLLARTQDVQSKAARKRPLGQQQTQVWTNQIGSTDRIKISTVQLMQDGNVVKVVPCIQDNYLRLIHNPKEAVDFVMDILATKEVRPTVTKGDLLELVFEIVMQYVYPREIGSIDVKLVGAHMAASGDAGGGGGDGGKDILVKKSDGWVIIDCKNYAKGNSVSVKEVRSIVGALIAHQGDEHVTGVVLSTSNFTPAAYRFEKHINKRFRALSMRRLDVQLWDNKEVREKIGDAMSPETYPFILGKIVDHLEKNKLLVIKR